MSDLEHQRLIAQLVPQGSRVLDLGCGDGALLAHLIAERDCVGHGVEIDGDLVLACIAAGVPVTEGAIENVLADFGDGAFDVVLLSWTLQTTRHPATHEPESEECDSLFRCFVRHASEPTVSSVFAGCST